MSNTEELKYVKVPLSENDFTEDGIKYTIPAKEFFKLVHEVEQHRLRIQRLELEVWELQSKESK